MKEGSSLTWNGTSKTTFAQAICSPGRGFWRDLSPINSAVDLDKCVQHPKSRYRLFSPMFLGVKGAYDNVFYEGKIGAREMAGLEVTYIT